LEKRGSENCNLAYIAIRKVEILYRIVTNRIASTNASGKTAKRSRYSNRAVTMSCMLKSWRYTPGKSFYE